MTLALLMVICSSAAHDLVPLAVITCSPLISSTFIYCGHDTHTPCCPYASTHNTVLWAYNMRVCEGRSGSLFLNREGHQEAQGLNPIWARQRAPNGLRSLSMATTSPSTGKALWSSWDPLEAFLLRWRVPA